MLLHLAPFVLWRREEEGVPQVEHQEADHPEACHGKRGADDQIDAEKLGAR